MGGVRTRLLRSAVLTCAFVAAAVAGPVASAQRPDTATPVGIDATFVVFERPHSGTTNLGPIDLVELFHPGGTGGGDNLPCTPDRLDVVSNEVTLWFDPVTRAVTGTATLVLSCQFHFGEGCVPEQRTVMVDFESGLLDPATLQMVGLASVTSSDRVTQDWGNAGVGDPSSCTWGTFSLGVVGPYELSWRLDLTTDPAVGFFAADLVAGDPAQRVGHFEVANPGSIRQIVALTAGAGDDSGSAAPQSPGGAEPVAVPQDGTPPDATLDSSAATTLPGSPGVFTPTPGGSGSSNTLWLAFFMLFVLLAAVFLFGRPMTRVVKRMLNR